MRVIVNQLDEKPRNNEPYKYDIDFSISQPDSGRKTLVSLRPYVEMAGLRFQTEISYSFIINFPETDWPLAMEDFIKHAQNEFTIQLRKEIGNPTHLAFFPPIEREVLRTRIAMALLISPSN